MKGETYVYEFIRIREREKALKALAAARKLQVERQALVDAGKARWVKEPISKGYKLKFELLE
jgi:hypothetical protein